MIFTNIYKNFYPLVNKYPVIKSFFFLTSGSVLVQGLNLLFIPVLAHLYGPYSFGIWTTFIALSVIAPVASLRYELGIIFSRSDRVALHVFILCFFLCCCISSVYALIIYIFSPFLSTLLNFPKIEALSIYLFFYVCGNGLYQISTHWLIRKKQHTIISFYRIFQSVSIFMFQIFFYYFGFYELGLVFGSSIGLLLSSFLGLLHLLPILNTFKLKFKIFKSVVFYYKNFLLYTTPYTLGGQAYKSLTVFLILRFFGMEYTGLYAIATRLVTTPLSLILQALSQVFLPEFSTKEKLLRNEVLIQKTMTLLSWTGGFFFGVGFIFMKEIIIFLFGEKWEPSADICKIMLVPYTLLIFEGWIDRSYDIIKKQRIMLIQDVFFNMMSVVAFFITVFMTHDFLKSLIALNIAIYIYYVIWIFLLFGYLNFNRLFLIKMFYKYYLWMLFVSILLLFFKRYIWIPLNF